MLSQNPGNLSAWPRINRLRSDAEYHGGCVVEFNALAATGRAEEVTNVRIISQTPALGLASENISQNSGKSSAGDWQANGY